MHYDNAKILKKCTIIVQILKNIYAPGGCFRYAQVYTPLRSGRNDG